MDEPDFNAFSRNGYCVVEDLINHADVLDLVRELSIPQNDAVLRRRGGAEFARRDLLRVSAVSALSRSLPVRALVDSILGTTAICVRAILFDKVDGANWTVPWHQDRSIALRNKMDVPGFGPWSVKAGIPHCDAPVELLERMVTLRIHLDDCPADNGPLRVIPCSHLDGKLDELEIRSRCQANREAVCTVRAGGVVVMRPLLLHASSPATVARHRRVVHLEYGPPVLEGGLQWYESDRVESPRSTSPSSINA